MFYIMYHKNFLLARDAGWRLIIDANLEASGTPVDELYGSLGLDGGDGSVNILRNHVTTVQHTAGHVLAVPRITFYHLVAGLKAGVGDLRNRHLFMVSFFS